jgi:hypothetical protein
MLGFLIRDAPDIRLIINPVRPDTGTEYPRRFSDKI